MVARRVVLRGIAGAVAGGNPAMRPDQQLQPTSRAGTGPAPQNAFLVNPIIVVTPGRGVFVYSPHPGLGNLISSIAATGGVDPYGNRYLPGVASYLVSGSGYVASQLTNGALFLQQNTTFGGAYTAAGEINIGGGGLFAFSPGSSVAYAFNPTVPLTAGQVILDPVSTPTAATTGELEVHGTVGLKNATAPASVAGYAEPFALGGNLAVVNGLAGDGQTYDTQVLHVRTYPAQTITLNSFTNVTGASVLVGAAHYTFRCRVLYTTAAAAGASQFQFTSPATTGNLSLMADWLPTGGGAPTNVSRNTTSSLSLAAGATLNGAGGGGNVTLEGDVTFSASGTLQLQAQTSIAGDNYVIQAVYLDLYPVNL